MKKRSEKVREILFSHAEMALAIIGEALYLARCDCLGQGQFLSPEVRVALTALMIANARIAADAAFRLGGLTEQDRRRVVVVLYTDNEQGSGGWMLSLLQAAFASAGWPADVGMTDIGDLITADEIVCLITEEE